ncbi:IPT/TIG domain-containing protein [Kitasatospora aureofaciens]|uniref:IPT/TIG domain-containing protein n=1 Tax=Kitasatospora aureofaciens TaxID=1894 RepID=UPI003406FA38
MPLTTGSRPAPGGRLRRLRRGAAAVLTAAVLSTGGTLLPATSARAAGPAQLVYATDSSSNSLVAYDLSSDSVVGKIPVGKLPRSLAVSPDGSQVWVANEMANSVSVVDTTVNTVIATLPVGRFPSALAFAPDGAHVYVAHNRGGHPGIDVYDTSTLTVTATIPVPYTASRLAPTPDGKRLYTAVSGNGTVAVIDTATNAVTATIPTADNRSISGLEISPDGTRVYATNVNTGTLSVLDPAAGKLVASVKVANSAGSLALSPDGTHAYIATSTNGILAVVDTATATVSGTVPIAGSPNRVLADPDGSKVYVATGTGKMVVIDARTNAVVRTTAMGAYPDDMVLAPAKPAVTGLAPAHGPTTGGTTVTLTGSHLTGTTAVTFDGTPASNVTVVNDTTVTATAPAHAAGAVDVTLTAKGRTTAAGRYTYDVPPPVVTALAPDHGPLAGGTTVTITGHGLTGTTAVSFGTTPATRFTVDSDTQITATTPAGSAAGKVGVTLTAPAGTSSTGQYTYDAPPAGSYVFAETADPASGSTVQPGDKVTYTVTVAQRGDGEVKGATITDDLAKVLDDATYNSDVKASTGSAEVKDGKLTWTGDLPVGASVTITYSVTVTGKGDNQLHNAVSSSDGKRGSCDPEKGCATDHTVQAVSSPTPTPTPTASSTAAPTATPAPAGDDLAPAAPAPAPEAPQSSGGILASTGTSVLAAVMIGGALLILGSFAVVVSRRRSRHS